MDVVPAEPPSLTPSHLEVLAPAGVPEVTAGSDLAGVLLAALGSAGMGLQDGDVLVVSSKVVSKASGLVVPVSDATTRQQVVDQQSRRVVASRMAPSGVTRIVEAVAGPVMAAAGVDASNTADGTLLTLPTDPDAAARALRRELRAAGAPLVAVVVSDTAGRPWRRGVTDFALGVAGLLPVEDLRGTTDAGGQVLSVTERALADQVAGAADLVKGKATGRPLALVRGLAEYVSDEDGPGAADLLRAAGSDWFRYGHVEAVRLALGVPLDDDEGTEETGGVRRGAVPGPPSVAPEPVRVRVERAVEVALLAPAGLAAAVADVQVTRSGDDVLVLTGDPFGRGVLAQRLLCALWAEDLDPTVEPGHERSVVRAVTGRV